MNIKNIAFSVPWNLFLITVGGVIFGFGLKSVVIPGGLITGGFSGAGVLIYYYTDILSPGVWYMVLNIPVFLLGWKIISCRFFLYSLYGAIILTLIIDLIDFKLVLEDPMLSVLAGGSIMGAGGGIILRSLGSAGGNDIISIILNQKFGIRIGTYNFVFNLCLFGLSFGFLTMDMVLYSVAMSFVTSTVMEYFIQLFNQRKMVFIISDQSGEIAEQIMVRLQRGVTILKGQGAYRKKDKNILMCVINTFQIKRVEEIVFVIDPDAFVVVENTFNVLGQGFSKQKIY